MLKIYIAFQMNTNNGERLDREWFELKSNAILSSVCEKICVLHIHQNITYQILGCTKSTFFSNTSFTINFGSPYLTITIKYLALIQITFFFIYPCFGHQKDIWCDTMWYLKADPLSTADTLERAALMSSDCSDVSFDLRMKEFLFFKNLWSGPS